MGIYSQYVLPRLINLAMQNKLAAAEREKCVPLASGKVLEVGIGSGLNIPFYSRNGLFAMFEASTSYGK